MAKNLEKKKSLISNIKNDIQDLNKDIDVKGLTAFVFNYSTFSSNEINNLRSLLFKNNAKLKILKNTLIKILFDQFKVKLDKKLQGQNALILVNENAFETIRALSDFVKKQKKGEFNLGVLENKILSQEKVIELTKLPEKQVLQSQLLSAFISPARSFLHVLNENQSKFVRVLNSIKDKKN